jgi:penicillin-binding protein 1A
VYGAAFENGARPTDTFMDEAVEISLGGGTVWRPTDAGPPSGQAMSLRDGLVYSKNTITAQVMQTVGPARVASLAQAAGVRQSKLEQVPSLALGTSPVTLKEMVASYSTLANNGSYIEPIVVLSVEDKNGKVLERFASKAPEQVMALSTAQTLVDAMRGVVDRGTGTAIRSRFGIQADVAGKTGTTQDNTDGWFILMHPQLVAGAWVGFNDNRITMGDGWGQGARSALPMVGDFFAQSLRTRVVDPQARFAVPQSTGSAEPLLGQVNDWFQRLFPPNPSPTSQPGPSQQPGVVWPPEPAPGPPLGRVVPPLSQPGVVIQDGSADPNNSRFVLVPARPVTGAERASVPGARESVPSATTDNAQ